jgi:hypothetical protein
MKTRDEVIKMLEAIKRDADGFGIMNDEIKARIIILEWILEDDIICSS